MSEQQIKEILDIDIGLDKMIRNLTKLFRRAAKDCEHAGIPMNGYSLNVCGHHDRRGYGVCKIFTCPLRNK